MKPPCLPCTTRQQLHQYLNLLKQWNKSINLIGKSTSYKMVRDHLADGLAMLRHLPAEKQTIADMGTGGGVPGMVIGIASQHEVHLIESNGKKCAFLRNVTAELRLKNVIVHQQRIEVCGLPKIDYFTARACASLEQLTKWMKIHAHQDSKGVFLKGSNVQQEIDSLSNDYKAIVQQQVFQKSIVLIESI